MLKRVQDLDGESSLPAAILESRGMSRQCLGLGGGGSLDGGGRH